MTPTYGFPALAYPTSDATSDTTSLWSCNLMAKHSTDRKQAIITLRSSISIHGFDEKQSFTLLYNADNLTTDKHSLGPATITPPQARLNEITRRKNYDLKTLSLTIKETCPILCPPSSGSIAPKCQLDPAFKQLVNLARATEINILFDYNRLHRDNHAQFKCLISHPEGLTGFPVSNYAKLYRQADWSVFIPIEDVVPEALPSYTNKFNKRPVQALTSLLDELPSPKRVSLAPSRTEKATAAPTPGPKPQSSPIAVAPDIQEAVDNAVKRLLPKALETILPDMLLRLSSTPTLSPLLSSLGTLVSAEMANRINSQLQEITTKFEDAEYECNVAFIKFEEDLEDTRLEIDSIKEDTIDDLTRIFDDMLNQFKESAAEIAEEIEEGVDQHAKNVYDKICDRLDILVEREGTCIEKKQQQGAGQYTAGGPAGDFIAL